MKTKSIVLIITYVIVSAAITAAIIYFARKQDDKKVDSFRIRETREARRVKRSEGADGPVAQVPIFTATGELDPKISIACDMDQDNDIDLYDIASYLGTPMNVGNMKFCGESQKGTIRVYADQCPDPPESGFAPNEPVLLVANTSIQWWNRTSDFLTGPK
jgi:hypothetical protein